MLEGVTLAVCLWYAHRVFMSVCECPRLVSGVVGVIQVVSSSVYILTMQ